MKVVFSILLLILVIWSPTAKASSFEICEYKIKVLAVGQKQLRVDVVETIVSPGFNAEKKTLACQGKINRGRIPLAKVSQGKTLIKKGARLKAEWKSYSAMGENGPISDVSWRFYEIND